MSSDTDFCYCDLCHAKVRNGLEFSLVPFYALAIMSKGVLCELCMDALRIEVAMVEPETQARLHNKMAQAASVAADRIRTRRKLECSPAPPTEMAVRGWKEKP